MSDKINQAILEWINGLHKKDSPYIVIRQSLYDPIVERLVFSQPNSVLDAIRAANKPEIFLMDYRPPFVSIVFSLNTTLYGGYHVE